MECAMADCDAEKVDTEAHLHATRETGIHDGIKRTPASNA